MINLARLAAAAVLLLVAAPAFAGDPPIALDGMYAFGFKSHARGSSACHKITPKQAAEMKPWKCQWTDTASNGRAVSCDSPDGKRGLVALPTRTACVDERETQASNAD